MGDVVTLKIDPDAVEAYTPHQIEKLLRVISKRLVEIIEAQRTNNTQWAEAKRSFLEKYHPAVIESYRADPSAPKWVHEAAAKALCVDEEATAFAWERVVRSHNDEAHSLRQIQSTLQSLLRTTDAEINPGRGYQQRGS